MKNEMNEMVTKMIDKINVRIEIANESFKQTGWSQSHALKMERIDGMIDMLAMVTGKDYIITENGLVEETRH